MSHAADNLFSMHSADACLQSLQVHCSTACRRLSPVRPNYPSCSCEPRVLAISDDCFRLVITSQDCVPRVRFSFAIRSLKLIHSNCIPAHRNKQGKSWTLYESTWCDNNFRTKPKRVCPLQTAHILAPDTGCTALCAGCPARNMQPVELTSDK